MKILIKKLRRRYFKVGTDINKSTHGSYAVGQSGKDTPAGEKPEEELPALRAGNAKAKPGEIAWIGRLKSKVYAECEKCTG
ncbi:MAG: hypothetical protein E7390_00470 [Ruminococcaceae bacterium]|nr:hypothetical protein [Oscillospiraceae bacterium]